MSIMRALTGFCLLLLSACAGPLDTGPGLAVLSDQFSEAMRWQDYATAGNFLQTDVREEFLELFQQDEDLRVVESRIVSVELDPEAKTARADYRLEFYRLPSMRVKKWQWTQQWQLQPKNALEAGVWLIVNSPPSRP